MSSVPKPNNKPKYNNSKPYEWVDSQWEKFMTEQKELKAMIKQLQEDLGTCTENFQIQRKQMEQLISRVPSSYLTNSTEFNGETHPEAKHTAISLGDTTEPKYVYESPDKGKTVYRRELGDYDTPRVQVDNDGNPLPTQMELF